MVGRALSLHGIESPEINCGDRHPVAKLSSAIALSGCETRSGSGSLAWEVRLTALLLLLLGLHDPDDGDGSFGIRESVGRRICGRRTLVGDHDRFAVVEELQADRVGAD